MLIRVTGGRDGIKRYLEDGQKDGREFGRDQLDERVVLAGDLEACDQVIQMIQGDGDRYLHITLSFKEDHISAQLLASVVEDFKAFAFSAHRDDEFSLYAEAHLPKIKSYTNRKTGELVERKPHIHIVIPDRNLLTGKRLNLFGRCANQEKYIDAFQEHVNHKYRLASPKDHRRLTFSGASEVISRYKGDSFANAKSTFRQTLLSAMILQDICTLSDFKRVVASHGKLRVRNEGQENEYLNVLRHGEQKGVNLKEYVFSPEFIALTTVEKQALLQKQVERKYEEVGTTRRNTANIDATLCEWHEVRSKEIKYINSGNRKFYAQYREADNAEKVAILSSREQQFYNKHTVELTDEQSRTQSTNKYIADNLRTADHHIGAARARAAALNGRAGKLLDRSTRRAIAAYVHRHQSDQVRPGQAIKLSTHCRLVDNIIGQHQFGSKERQQAKKVGQSSEMSDIKLQLEGSRLLKYLAHTKGVIPAKYSVETGVDGGTRIVCGNRKLNVTDFMTTELKLPWSEAIPILRHVYALQVDRQPVHADLQSPHDSGLWHKFQAWKSEPINKRANLRNSQRDSERLRRSEISASLKVEKLRICERLSNPAERRAALSIARMERVIQDKSLCAEITSERCRLKASFAVKAEGQFRSFLQERAQSGDGRALAELRRRRIEPEANDYSACKLTPVGKAKAFHQGDTFFEQSLAWRVALNGDVTYQMQGRDALRDEARSITFLESKDVCVVEAGLRLALQKFGPKLLVQGDEAFKRQIVEVSIAAGLRVDFSCQVLNAHRDRLLSNTDITSQIPGVVVKDPKPTVSLDIPADSRQPSDTADDPDSQAPNMSA